MIKKICALELLSLNLICKLYFCISLFLFKVFQIRCCSLILLGVVLFPEATLPLRVVQPNFIATIERALSQIDQGAPLTIGVVSETLASSCAFPFGFHFESSNDILTFCLDSHVPQSTEWKIKIWNNWDNC